MPYLLDTNICSFVLKTKPLKVYTKLTTVDPSEVFVSVVTVYELATGCEKSPRRNLLFPEVQNFLRAFSILNFDEDHAYRTASLRAQLEKAGTPIGPYDLMLAAQALSESLTFVTNNTREFQKIGTLIIEDWSR